MGIRIKAVVTCEGCSEEFEVELELERPRLESSCGCCPGPEAEHFVISRPWGKHCPKCKREAI